MIAFMRAELNIIKGDKPTAGDTGQAQIVEKESGNRASIRRPRPVAFVWALILNICCQSIPEKPVMIAIPQALVGKTCKWRLNEPARVETGPVHQRLDGKEVPNVESALESPL
jgi:hypothetical protein